VSTTLTLKDRIARAVQHAQRFQLVIGMLLAEHASSVTDKVFSKDLLDVFTYKTKDPKTGKQVSRWLYPESTIGRWRNAGAVALVLGYSTGDDDQGTEDLPSQAVVAPLYAILKTGKDLEQGEALDAIHEAVRAAWTAANEAFVESNGRKTLLQCVEAEVARRTKKKKNPSSGNGGNGGGSESNESDQTVTFDPAAVIALRPTLDAWVRKTSSDLRVSQSKVRTIMVEACRFIGEHGHAVVGPALLLTDEEVQEDQGS